MLKPKDMPLPKNAKLSGAFATMEKSEGANSTLEMWKDVIAAGGCGLQPTHAQAMADAILAVKRRAFIRKNQFLPAAVLAKRQPKERRADKTLAGYIIAFIGTGVAAKPFATMCGLSGSVDVVANSCEEATVYYKKHNAMPGDKALLAIVQSHAKAKRKPSRKPRKASLYLADTIKSVEALQTHHPRFARDQVALMLRTAKHAMKDAVAAEKKAKAEADKE